ncbi:hydrolase 1, exosortase A system-associated [Novosphingobium soli]|uniref:Hydrolase 1, exosortase A system-associated n=1 Tax=Novosphingobium soli TaxID=574956 RepID=A0ABV6CVQ9_9SPHN
MTRRHLTFDCAGDRLVGTLDTASGRTALLVVSGGNEVRAGAWNGQSLLAARVAEAGHPVLRFDRRGVGDSEGANRGFRGSAADIAAARNALRAHCPQVERIVGFGNCDAASSLMLAKGAGLDALVLSNPWTLEDESAAAPSAVVRSHYRRRLADPAAIGRLLTGRVSFTKLARSLAAAARPAPHAMHGLAAEIAAGIAHFRGPVRILVAGRDRTGQTFLARWPRHDARIRSFAEATHSYVEPEAQEWLAAQMLEALSST